MGDVIIAVGIGVERPVSLGSIINAIGVVAERITSLGGVMTADCILTQSTDANSEVIRASCVTCQRPSTNRSIICPGTRSQSYTYPKSQFSSGITVGIWYDCVATYFYCHCVSSCIEEMLIVNIFAPLELVNKYLSYFTEYFFRTDVCFDIIPTLRP